VIGERRDESIGITIETLKRPKVSSASRRPCCEKVTIFRKPENGTIDYRDHSHILRRKNGEMSRNACRYTIWLPSLCQYSSARQATGNKARLINRPYFFRVGLCSLHSSSRRENGENKGSFFRAGKHASEIRPLSRLDVLIELAIPYVAGGVSTVRAACLFNLHQTPAS
jgi:hypothetical protein